MYQKGLGFGLALAFSGFFLAKQALAAQTVQPSPSTLNNAADDCGPAGTLVVDGYSNRKAILTRKLKAFAKRNGGQRLFDGRPVQVLENGLPPSHFMAAYKFRCSARVSAAMQDASWNGVLASMTPSPDQRITVFLSDPDHETPSRRTPVCKKPVYLVLKGKVSDAPRYFGYLRGLSRSGLLARHGFNREVVMPGKEVRVAWTGESFGQGEFFEVLRFPCQQEVAAFWESPEYRALVPLREGAMRADVWIYR